MKTTTLVATLTRLTTAMAVAAPIVVFGFLYVLQVQPERLAALEARHELAAARDELDRQRVLVTQPAAANVSALEEFDARSARGDGGGEVAEAIAAMLKDPAIGGVSNLSIATGASHQTPNDAMARLFGGPSQTALTVTFDGRYEQVGRFLSGLRTLPTISDLQSVELTQAPGARAGLMRAKVALVAFHRSTAGPAAALDVSRASKAGPPKTGTRPQARRVVLHDAAPVQPAPVVTSIIVSGSRSIALIDGRIVRQGDRVRTGIVQSIERDAVLILGPEGTLRRVEIARPINRTARP